MRLSKLIIVTFGQFRMSQWKKLNYFSEAQFKNDDDTDDSEWDEAES